MSDDNGIYVEPPQDDPPTDPVPVQEPPSDLEPVASEPVIPEGVWSAATSTWISAHVRNSAIAQHVEAWSHLGAILPQLKVYLETELARFHAAPKP